MTIDEKLSDDGSSTNEKPGLGDYVIANALKNLKNISASYRAIENLTTRLDFENKYFVKIFAKEEFSDLETRKKFIKDDLFRENYFNEEFKKTAGDEVYNECLRMFGDYTCARQWYFSRIPALDYKRPYEYCRKGDNKEIADMLGRLEWGILS